MNKVTIDIEARFVDHVSSESKSASKAVEGIGKSADKAQKQVDNLSKKKAKPIFDADNNKFLNKVRSMEAKMNKLGHKKTAAVLDVVDRATQKIGKIINKAQSFAHKTWRGIIDFNDSKALNSIRKITSGAENLTRKTWTTMVKVKDMALSPIKAIKNALFSIPTLITAVISAKVVQKGVLEPVSLADQYTNAKIGFSTLIGESRGQAMMNEIDQFAAETPFKTSNVISNVQKMMAYGWDVERVIDDMKTIGDAAAATGKGDEGLASIVYALSEIRTKGKLSTQELNQLASAGIKAKMYLAEGLGYGTDDAGLMKLAADLEDGAIGANQAIDLILQGMEEYDGMMDKMANTTVKGLKDQLVDLFEINVSRKWGQGLQDGLIKGLGSVTSLIDGAGDSLSAIGDTMYELGKIASNWLAEKLEKVVNKIKEITDSYEFKSASAGEKVSMLWEGVVKDPLKNWWNETGKEAVTNTAVDIGKSIGQGILSGIEIAWNALPWWGKLLVGGYGAGKTLSGIGNVIGGAKNLWSAGKGIIGSTGNSMVGGSGILGKLADIGYNTTGGAASAAGYFGMAGMSGGKAALVGAAKFAGVAGTIYNGLQSAGDFYSAYKAGKSGDKVTRNAKIAEGAWRAGGTAAGALVGNLILPGLGGWIGGALGGWLGGWLGGKHGKSIRAKGYGENASQAIKGGKSEEEILEAHNRDRWQDAKDHFGDIKLTMQEISRLAQQAVWGDEDLKYFEQFSAATKGAKENLQSFKAAAQDADKWMWKAGLGVTFNEDEKEAFALSFSDYFSNAQSLLTNKHYEFAMAAELVLDTETDMGKSIVEGVNSYYAQQQADLEAAGQELGNALTNALADGFIAADEQKAITAAQEKIAGIMEKISDAEMQAELELAKFKFTSGNMDSESYKQFMESLTAQIEERAGAQDDAVKIVLSNLKLQYTGEDGSITNIDEYNEKVKAVLADHGIKIDEIKAQVMGFAIEPLAEAYDIDMSKITSALDEALYNNLDPIEWSNDDIRTWLGIDNLTNATADNLREALSTIFAQMKLMDIDVDAVLGVNATVEEGTTDKVHQQIKVAVGNNGPVDITANFSPRFVGKLDSKSNWGIQDSYPFDTTLNITGKDKTNKIDLNSKSKWGIQDSYQFDTTVYVNANYVKNPFDEPSKQKKFRGGIVGYSDGGMVRGGSQLIEVAEEGSPEMIIPLSSQRRGRALKLWAQAGNMMGVPGFARGGLTSGGNDEGIRFQSYDSGNTAAGGQDIQIEVGGLTFEINVNSENPQSIVESIKAQANEIAEVVAGVIADSLGAQFENTPAKGGAY